MATYQGTEGGASFGGSVVAQVKAWTLTVNMDVVETSVMGDKWRTKTGTMATWSGSVDVLLDTASATGTTQAAMMTRLVAATSVRTSLAVTLIASSSTGATYFTGSAIITGVQPGAQMEQLNAATFNFEGTGVLAFDEA
jgi:hypothetical protein